MDTLMNFSNTDKHNVLLIDDEHFIHDLVRTVLSDCCNLICVETGEDALMISRECKPGLILIDVEMPGMGGYDTCRLFKQSEETSHIPVIFLSDNAGIEDRLKGYEAGGEEYLAKPFDSVELKIKVSQWLALTTKQNELKSMADFASGAAMTAMTSMSELGSMQEILKKFNTCEDWPGLAAAMIDGLAVFDLRGTVQIRALQGHLTVTDRGLASPMELSVIEHMLGMDRIVQFKNHLSINYECVSLLVNNMPKGDDDRCGRLRDHLAMLAEAADVRVKSILTMQESNSRGSVIDHALLQISKSLLELDAKQRNNQINTRLAVDSMNNNVAKALMSVALSDSQEMFLVETIRYGIDNILNSQSNEIDLQNQLGELILELKSCMPAKQLAEIHPWTDNMLLGVDVIDDDHRKLVEMLNELVLEINQESGIVVVVDLIFAIAQYSKSHFEREEFIMSRLHYSNAEAHKADHKRLIAEINALGNRLSNGTDSLTADVIKYLHGWFMDHIHEFDAELVNHMPEISTQYR